MHTYRNGTPHKYTSTDNWHKHDLQSKEHIKQSSPKWQHYDSISLKNQQSLRTFYKTQGFN